MDEDFIKGLDILLPGRTVKAVIGTVVDGITHVGIVFEDYSVLSLDATGGTWHQGGFPAEAVQ